MPNSTVAYREAHSLWSSLESEFQRYYDAINYIPIGKTRIQDDLRRYLCLRCAGFLEKLVFECTLKYLETKAGGPALEFAKSYFSHAPNLNAESFSRLIGRFGKDHAERFEEFLTPPLRDSLNDLASVRNPIAHGEVAGGQKLNPDRYLRLCEAVYTWLTADLLAPAGVVIRVADQAEPPSV